MTTNPIEPPIKIIEFDAESDDSELCCSSWSGLLTSPSKSSVIPSELSWSCSSEQPNSLTESPLEVPAQISVLSPTPSLSASDHSVESIGKRLRQHETDYRNTIAITVIIAIWPRISLWLHLFVIIWMPSESSSVSALFPMLSESSTHSLASSGSMTESP